MRLRIASSRLRVTPIFDVWADQRRGWSAGADHDCDGVSGRVLSSRLLCDFFVFFAVKVDAEQHKRLRFDQGFGPPVAQSINSIAWTTGTGTAAAIWARQPMLPVAMNFGVVSISAFAFAFCRRPAISGSRML